MQPTSAMVAPGVPREMLPRNSPEYALRTLQHIQNLSLAAKYTLRDLEAALAEAREARIHEIWPEHRYQSVEELIEHELGESVAAMQARKRSQAAAIATKVEDVLPVGGNHGGSNTNLVLEKRAAKNGISKAQQQKLDKLARQAPDLLEEVRAGRISVNAAMINAGFEQQKITIPTGLLPLARYIRKHFSEIEIQQLIRELEAGASTS